LFFQVDNSGLTGESKAVALSPERSDPTVLESRNMAFFSTSVIQGNGRGVVVQTGDNTIMGSIAHLVSNLHSGGSPIKKVNPTHVPAVLFLIRSSILLKVR
jgi:sodium/potassium-transporting ATPase subunit alpha